MPTDKERYLAAVHAIQTGVAFDQEAGSGDGTPKHLRTGINVTKCDQAALVRLLVDKGILTEAEYVKAMADEAEREVARYEERLKDRFGREIKLH